MGKFINALSVASELAIHGRFQEFARRSFGLIYRERRTFGLRRDLAVPIQHRKAKIPITVRKLIKDDVPVIFPDVSTKLSRKEKVELETRRAMFDAGVTQCYVAIDENGTPCYFQWRLDWRQNPFLQSRFPRNWFPILRDDETLLENAYTPVAYRGKGIMSEAMAIIAETGREANARYAITFVDTENVPSLKACASAGFRPDLVRHERSYLAGAVSRRHFTSANPTSQSAAGLSTVG